MSTIITLLNLDQSLRLRGVTKLSKAQLKVAIANNEELQALRQQLSQDMTEIAGLINEQNKNQQRAAVIQEQILKNQIKEIERNEEQAFNKKRIFQCSEYLKDFDKLSDNLAKNYFKLSLLPFMKEAIAECKETLEEISDKNFCSQLQAEIAKINNCEVNQSMKEINPLLEYSKKVEVEKEINVGLKEQRTQLRQNEMNNNWIRDTKADKQMKFHNMFIALVFVLAVILIVRIVNTFSSIFSEKDNSLVLGTTIFLIVWLILLLSFLYYKKNLKKEVYLEVEKIDIEKSNHDKLNKRIVASNNNIKLLVEEYRNVYNQLLFEHPDFKIIDYILPDFN